MPVIATDTPRFSNLVKHEYEPSIAYCRELLTVASGNYPLGTVLGKVTATGAWVVAKETATDGSKVPAAVVIQAGTGVTKVLAFVRGPARVSKKALILDTTYDTDAKKKALYEGLEAKGIIVDETV